MSTDAERSVSRGREQVSNVSSGRGGAGNVKSASGSPDAEAYNAAPGPDDRSQSRGRELTAPSNGNDVIASGRGGAGNSQSRSRGPGVESLNALREEARYVREQANSGIAVSHGRGGVGNIANSRSRSGTRDAGPTSPVSPTSPTLERLREEGSSSSRGRDEHKRTSSLSKITNLFRRGSRDAERYSPELPEE